MKPLKHDIVIRRGATFEIEAVSETKIYGYNPEVNNTIGDDVRTYAENLAKYGFVHAYVDYETIYDKAELVIFKVINSRRKVLLTRTLEDEDIVLSDKSIKATIRAEATKDIDFDDAMFELLVTVTEALPPEDAGAGVTSNDQVDCVLYGSVTVTGEK